MKLQVTGNFSPSIISDFFVLKGLLDLECANEEEN